MIPVHGTAEYAVMAYQLEMDRAQIEKMLGRLDGKPRGGDALRGRWFDSSRPKEPSREKLGHPPSFPQ